MKGKIFKQAICVILSLMMFGCKSAYDLTLYSQPSGVAVEISPDIQGRTPCNVRIPHDSDLIKHHILDVTYILDDGREIVKSYDMRNYEPPEPTVLGTVGGVIGACLILPGMFLVWISGSGNKDDDDDNQYNPFYKVDEEKEKEKKEKDKAGLLGFGMIILGAITFGIFSGDEDRQYEYDIYENFEEVNRMPNR